MEPSAVAQVILRAATTRPRLRYLVGRDAKALMLLKRLLPGALFERLSRRLTTNWRAHRARFSRMMSELRK